MKAYSLDLREKVVNRYEAGGISQRELARAFGVSLFFVEKMLKLKRIGDSLAPKKSRAASGSKLTGEMRLFVSEQIKEQNDLTLPELCERVMERFAVRVSPPVMCRAVRLMDLRRKKRRSTPQSAKPSA
jgi:transposase